MSDLTVTVVGNVATEPTLRMTKGGVRVASFRVGCTRRQFDKQLNGWRDADRVFWSVSCWRNVAENVMDSLKVGDPVVIFGRFRENTYEGKDGVRRTNNEIVALSMGHDLSRGVSRFTRASFGAGREVDDSDVIRDDDFDEADGVAPEDDEPSPSPAVDLPGSAHVA